MDPELSKHFTMLLREMAASIDDTKVAHIYADDVLCALLDRLGYTDVVAAWRDIKKWYA